MRSRIFQIIVGLVTVLAVAACGSNNKDAAPGSGTTTGTHAAQNQGEGDPINVNARLIKQGFKQDRIGAVESNAAYWLYPFQAPADMMRNPKHGNATCSFMMVREDYKKGDAYADHRIMLHSRVRLTPYLIGSDGVQGPSLPKSAVVEFSKLSPAWLAGAGKEFGGLEICGDLTAR